MLDNQKLSRLQFCILVLLYTVGTSILVIPPSLVSIAKQDVWISLIFGLVIGLLLVSLYNVIANTFPNYTLFEINEKVLGKWVGKAVSCLFFCFTLLLSSLVLRNIGDFMVTQVMPETPIAFIHALVLIAVIFGSRLGLKVIGRTSEVFLPWVFLFFFILIAFNLHNVEITNIQPVFKQNTKSILRASSVFIGVPFLELVTFLMIHPFVNCPKSSRKGLLIGTLIGGLMIITITIMSILVLGVDVTSRTAYPSYVLGKKINIGGFLERFEVIVALLWIFSSYFKLIILFYVTAVGISKTLGTMDYRSLLFPMGLILMALSIIVYPNGPYVQSFVSNTWPPFAATFGLFFPLILLIVAKFRKKN